MATATGDRTTRRRGRRQLGPTTPAALGSALREAREASTVTLAEVHDRAGVPWQQLEALEGGDLSLFPDQDAAVVAVRRYADLVGLDADQLGAAVTRFWGTAAAGFPELPQGDTGKRRRDRRRTFAEGGPAPTTEHLRRYPGDGTHLRAFTQTDQVPGVRRVDVAVGGAGDPAGQFTSTGVFPTTSGWAPPPRRPLPVVLGVAIWCTLVLLVVGAAGLAVHHWRPQWLVDIRVEHVPSHTPTTVATQGAGTGSSPTTVPKHSSPVTLTSNGVASASVSVHAATYSVVVAANGGPVWVRGTVPQAFAPVVNETLPAGQDATIPAGNGQLTLSLGSSYALVAVQIDGKTAPGFLFKPSAAPYVMNFTSSG
ncbi:MAG TPA: helix-turn-helix transcriptional regulator [Acidimicrobiales bacterium]|nr:helix-turn-helix transcriptional regulator [Acidimicrobiales bacterium]